MQENTHDFNDDRQLEKAVLPPKTNEKYIS